MTLGLQADARKLLVLDINELRYRQEDLILQQQAASQYASGEDPTTLRIALKWVNNCFETRNCLHAEKTSINFVPNKHLYQHWEDDY